MENLKQNTVNSHELNHLNTGLTVGQLIKELEKYPKELTLTFALDYDGSWSVVQKVEEGVLNMNEDFGLYQGRNKDDIIRDFNPSKPCFKDVLIVKGG